MAKAEVIVNVKESTYTFLTPQEHELIGLLGSCWNRYSKIVADGPSREADCREFVAHVHDLQNAVMAQAAARAYPATYRLAGGVVEPLQEDS